MPDEEPKDETPEEDDSEEKFFQRVKAMSKEAMNEWAAELSAEIDEEEEKKPAIQRTEPPATMGSGRVKVEFEARKKQPPKAEEPKEDEAEDEDEPEPSAAERARDAGRRGPRRSSPYWERVKRYF